METKLKYIASAFLLYIGTMSMTAQKYDRRNLLSKSDSLYAIGVNLYNAGKYKEAIPLFTESDQIDKAVLDSESARREYSSMWLASCYYKLNDSERASSISPVYYMISPVDRRLTVQSDSLEEAGMKYLEEGDLLSAYNCIYKASEIEREKLGMCVSYANSLTVLSELMQMAGDSVNAVTFQNYSDKINRKAFTGCIPAMNKLAGYHADSGNYAEAIRLNKDAVLIAETHLGKESNYYATLLGNLAHYYSKAGDYNESIRLNTEVLNLKEKLSGKQNNSYATTLMNQSINYSRIGEYSKAKRLATEVLDIREKALGKDNDSYAKALSSLSAICSELGEYSEAIGLSTEAVNIQEKLHGKMSLEYAFSLNNLASAYSFIGNNSEAVRLGTEVLGIRDKLLGKEHPDYAMALSNLANYYYGTGNFDKAVTLETEALNVKEKKFGKDNSHYALSLSNLASYYSAMGNHNEAIRLCTEALNIREKVLGKEHPKYASSLNNLANYYLDSGNYSEAVNFCNEALKIKEKTLGKRHPDYTTLLFNLAYAHLKAGNTADADNLFVEYLTLMKEFVCHTIEGLSREEKSQYWSSYEYALTYFPVIRATENSSDKMTETSYSSLLFAKGLMLNADTELRKLLAENGNEKVTQAYDALADNRALLHKLYELPMAARTLSTDSLRALVNAQERELIDMSKQYGDYTKNLLIDWKDVQAKLTANDIAVEFATYHTGDGTSYYAYLLKKNYIKPKMVACFRTQNHINSQDLYLDGKLSKYIWGSFADELVDVKNIYFGPSGELYNIAIESLPDWEDPTKLVSDRWNFYRLSSTRELAVIQNKYPIKQSVVYGGLTYDTDTASMQRDRLKYPDVIRDFSSNPEIADSLNIRAGVRELPGTKLEASAIDQKLKAVRIDDIIRTDTIGTETSFKALSGQKKNLLHIATHGFYWTETEAKKNNYNFLALHNDDKRYQEDKALTRSGLLFAGANNALKGRPLPKDVDDGILTAQEIAQLDLRGLNLVVLSACETGLGEITGDGVFGLQRGFKKSGAQSILMSLWNVDDTATQILMTQFYTNLTNGKNKRQSLLDAQRYLREYEVEETVKPSSNLTLAQQKQINKKETNVEQKGSTRKNHPYAKPQYWAAFILLDAID
jgi:CHAT domain-containing protein/tetratricopeptide (TPR) repeat protein